jgi:hypothetical protein
MADSNKQNNQNSDDQKVINLTNVQKLEEESAKDSDILAAEDELLGLDKPVTSGSQGKKNTSQYHIPQLVKQEYPDLIPLILNTESMDDEEREYWFQILPIMTDDQVQKLKNILVNEKKQLAKLDAEYEAELAKINEKHLSEWQAFENRQFREKLEKKEKAHEKKESSLEEDLLNKLSEL